MDNLYKRLISFHESDPKHKKWLRYTRRPFIPVRITPTIQVIEKDESNKTEPETMIRSYVFQENAYFLKNKILPTYARGLFLAEDTGRIVIRGYDKFFNLEETPSTKWSSIETNTKGPYELLVKENGCLFLVSAFQGSLIFSSKHALFSPDVSEEQGSLKPSHAAKGAEWLARHLSTQSTSTRSLEDALIDFLETRNVTAAFELVDDDFEEHLLEYPPERRGLYIHGLIQNSDDLQFLPFEECDLFARRFGCHIVECITKATLEEAKEFMDACKEKGMYNGRYIEGFVVRCQNRVTETNDTPSLDVYRPFVFKCKFDEPYGMFREWRNATYAILNGSPNSFRPRYASTDAYMSWVVQKQRQDPLFFKSFVQHKGVIRARNAFLLEQGQVQGAETNPDFIQMAKESSHKIDSESSFSLTSLALSQGSVKILIMPVAVIGAGKTTLGRTLTHLYPDHIGHIQNDNITAKKSANEFERQVLSLFLTKDIVYADRNNHLFQIRFSLSRAFKAKYPTGRIMALQWDFHEWDKKELIDFAAERVMARGENHQSLKPSNPKYRSIIASFVFHNNPVDISHQSDQFIDQVVSMSIRDTVPQHLEKLVPHVLNLPLFEPDRIQEAIQFSFSSRETVTKNVGRSSSKSMITPYRYFGIRLGAPFYHAMVQAVKRDSELLGLWNRFEEKGRISCVDGKDWHVTLCVNAKNVSESHLKLYHLFATKLSLNDKNEPSSSSSEEDTSQEIPLLATPCTVFIDAIYSDGRLLVASVFNWSPALKCANKYPHITIATISDEVKAYESNVLLEAYHEEQKKNNSITIERHVLVEPLSITGIFDGFS